MIQRHLQMVILVLLVDIVCGCDRFHGRNVLQFSVFLFFFLFLLIFIFFYSSLRLYRKNYIESVNVDVLNDIYVGKIFCGWDYQIRSAKSSALKRSAFVKDLKVRINEDNFENFFNV